MVPSPTQRNNVMPFCRTWWTGCRWVSTARCGTGRTGRSIRGLVAGDGGQQSLSLMDLSVRQQRAFGIADASRRLRGYRNLIRCGGRDLGVIGAAEEVTAATLGFGRHEDLTIELACLIRDGGAIGLRELLIERAYRERRAMMREGIRRLLLN